MSSPCGCCEGRAPSTPAPLDNRPGLRAVAYRTGTWQQFLDTMLARLSQVGPAALTARTDDFAVAVLDGWSVVADILAFYQERWANEAWLRTATERRSVAELARLIGYQPRPGVAARAVLAFTMPDAPGAPAAATIDVGTAVQSVPEPGEQVHVFETVEAIEARPAWNALRPRATSPQAITEGTRTLRLAGTGTNVKAGDAMLFEADGAPAFGRVVSVDLGFDDTEVTLDLVPTAPLRGVAPSAGSSATALGGLARTYEGCVVTAADLAAQALAGGFSVDDLLDNFAACPPAPTHVFVFRARAAVFGHNALPFASLPESVQATFVPPLNEHLRGSRIKGRKPSLDPRWADATLDAYPGRRGARVLLDSTYDGVAVGSAVVLQDGAKWAIYRVEGTADLSVSHFALTGRVTRLTLDKAESFGSFGIRRTTVYGRPEAVALADAPLTTSVSGTEVALGTWVEGLHAGRRVVVTGESATVRGTDIRHETTLAEVEHVLRRGEGTRLTLAAPLPDELVRSTVVVAANCALATHGETRSEVLGDGDATAAFPRFALRQPPLTWRSAPTPSGTASTLEVYVNDVRWHEVPSLCERGPAERVYVTRSDEDGRTSVQFGDGRTGARLPTGQQNVRARYRKGIGADAMVRADRLTQLMSRASGASGVTNPCRAQGGDDAERLDDARENAPLTVLTLDRVVSLQDYEDFARAFAGITKAQATWTPAAGGRSVLLTVAGRDGEAVDDEVSANLLAALRRWGDEFVPVTVRPHRSRVFRVGGSLALDPDAVAGTVVAAVVDAMRQAFSFAARSFGQPVALSEVVAVVHSVPGVVALDVDELFRVDKGPGPSPSALLPAEPAGGGLGAELVTLDPGPITFGVLS